MITTLVEDLLALVEVLKQDSRYLMVADRLHSTLANHGVAKPLEGTVTSEEPDLALLVSMANRMDHGFFLMSKREQEQMISDMRRCWEEVTGKGFYKPENRQFYLDQLKK